MGTSRRDDGFEDAGASRGWRLGSRSANGSRWSPRRRRSDEIVVYALRARDDEDEDEDEEDDAFDEVTRVTHDGAVTCAALERDRRHAGGSTARAPRGHRRQRLYARVRTLLGHKIVTLSGEEDGELPTALDGVGIEKCLAWACDAGVKLYDVGRDEKVAARRATAQESAGARRSRRDVTWNETSDNSDVIGGMGGLRQGGEDSTGFRGRREETARGAERVRRARILGELGRRLAPSTSDVAPGMSYVARVTSMFQTEYYVAGIQPFGDGREPAPLRGLHGLAVRRRQDGTGVAERRRDRRHRDERRRAGAGAADSFGLALAQVPLETTRAGSRARGRPE